VDDQHAGQLARSRGIDDMQSLAQHIAGMVFDDGLLDLGPQ